MQKLDKAGISSKKGKDQSGAVAATEQIRTWVSIFFKLVASQTNTSNFALDWSYLG